MLTINGQWFSFVSLRLFFTLGGDSHVLPLRRQADIVFLRHGRTHARYRFFSYCLLLYELVSVGCNAYCARLSVVYRTKTVGFWRLSRRRRAERIVYLSPFPKPRKVLVAPPLPREPTPLYMYGARGRGGRTHEMYTDSVCLATLERNWNTKETSPESRKPFFLLCVIPDIWTWPNLPLFENDIFRQVWQFLNGKKRNTTSIKTKMVKLTFFYSNTFYSTRHCITV